MSFLSALGNSGGAGGLTQAAGAGISAGGAISAARAAAAVGSFDQSVAGTNATQALTSAAATAGIQGQDVERVAGRAGAAFGAAGVQMSGSPLAVMANLAQQGELQKQLTLYGGATRAQAYRTQGAIAAAEGQATSSADLARGVGTLLTGAASAGRGISQLSSTALPATQVS